MIDPSELDVVMLHHPLPGDMCIATFIRAGCGDSWIYQSTIVTIDWSRDTDHVDNNGRLIVYGLAFIDTTHPYDDTVLLTFSSRLIRV